MRECEFKRLASVVDGLVDSVVLYFLVQEVKKSVLASEHLLVVLKGKACVEVAVVVEPLYYEVVVELVLSKDLRVRSELREGSVWLVRLSFVLLCKDSLLEEGLEVAAVPERLYMEPRTQSVDCLGANAVEPYAELEDVVVVLGSCVYLRYAVYDLSKRDSPSLVAHAHCVVLQLYDNPVAGSHYELIYAVVYDFLHEDVYAVIHMGSVAKPSNVHTGSEPYVLKRRHGLYSRFVVYGL